MRTQRIDLIEKTWRLESDGEPARCRRSHRPLQGLPAAPFRTDEWQGGTAAPGDEGREAVAKRKDGCAPPSGKDGLDKLEP